MYLFKRHVFPFALFLCTIALICVCWNLYSLKSSRIEIGPDNFSEKYKNDKPAVIHVEKIAAKGSIYWAGDLHNVCFVEVTNDGEAAAYVPVILSLDDEKNFISNEELESIEDISAVSFDTDIEGFIFETSDKANEKFMSDLQKTGIYRFYSEEMLTPYHINYSNSDYFYWIWIAVLSVFELILIISTIVVFKAWAQRY